MAKFVVMFTNESDCEVEPLKAQTWDEAFAEVEKMSTLMEGQRGKTILNEEQVVDMMQKLEEAFKG